MNAWEKKLEAILDAGQQPTYRELEEAVADALEEKRMFGKFTGDLMGWIGKLVTAHLQHDTMEVAVTLDALINERLKLAHKNKDGLH